MTGNTSPKSPLIRALYDSPLSGPEIEAQSLAFIDREAPLHSFGAGEWVVVRRLIHTTGDFSIMKSVRFSPEALSSGMNALRQGAIIYVDSNMIRAGLSLARLRAVYGQYESRRILCHIADEDVAGEARAGGLPRSLFAVRKAKPRLDGGIAVFGNAPVGLLELNRMIIEEKVRPALVIAVPVGFIHVKESKEELISLNVPFIAVEGRRGGSPLAVSVIHALCSLVAPKTMIV